MSRGSVFNKKCKIEITDPELFSVQSYEFSIQYQRKQTTKFLHSMLCYYLPHHVMLYNM